ncbi:hypothetical protein [Sulfitobacter faviae]|uniref:hypothetical protein n=1 Tax=Sulfitobacter faviae TaxID=1775881 RepID=UPI0024581F29|nr:hypothetical protein [Sulfitobacter faviae]MDH4538944.1 hypothetical protein [Sulfitobacter faviae]
MIRLNTRSTLTAALSLLNQPPMRVMDKAGLPVTLADGEAVLKGTLALPLKKGGKPEDVRYHFAGICWRSRPIRWSKTGAFRPANCPSPPTMTVSPSAARGVSTGWASTGNGRRRSAPARIKAV